MQLPAEIEPPPALPPSNAMPGQKMPVSSEALLGPRGELLIEHRGRAYCLRITQNGKLILTA
jgi:hemin uptake protein HemP